MILTLTKKSKDKLFSQHIGTGQIFIKTAPNEYGSIEFWLGRNGTFYIPGPEELSKYFSSLANKLKDIQDFE